MRADFESIVDGGSKTLRIKDGIPALGHHCGLGFIAVFKPLPSLPSQTSGRSSTKTVSSEGNQCLGSDRTREASLPYPRRDAATSKFVEGSDTTTWYAEIVCAVEN